MKRMFALAAMFAVLSLAGFSAVPVEAASGPNFGCFKVKAHSLNIRARPYGSSKVIGTASKGQYVVKRKLFCTPRGFWCAVRHGKLNGYADKKYMKKTSCPSGL